MEISTVEDDEIRTSPTVQSVLHIRSEQFSLYSSLVLQY